MAGKRIKRSAIERAVGVRLTCAEGVPCLSPPPGCLICVFGASRSARPICLIGGFERASSRESLRTAVGASADAVGLTGGLRSWGRCVSTRFPNT